MADRDSLSPFGEFARLRSWLHPVSSGGPFAQTGTSSPLRKSECSSGLVTCSQVDTDEGSYLGIVSEGAQEGTARTHPLPSAAGTFYMASIVPPPSPEIMLVRSQEAGEFYPGDRGDRLKNFTQGRNRAETCVLQDRKMGRDWRHEVC